jgi:rRNA biogenesis protein RRP5
MSFPRGGSVAKATTPSKSGTEDVLFGSKKRLNRIEDRTLDSKKKARTEAATSLSLASAVGAGMTKQQAGSTKLKVESMVFNKYQSGCQALGYVLQILDDRAIISLPGGTVGTVHLKNISDASYRIMTQYETELSLKKEQFKQSGKKYIYKDLIKSLNMSKPDITTLITVMQPVRCIVLNQVIIEGSKRKAIELSMRSSLLNKGLTMKHMTQDYPLSTCIVSREDHGYILSAGLSDCNLFLPLKAVPIQMGELVVGKYKF